MGLMEGKIKERAELAKIVGRLKAEGKRIVFTNGCFDIIHRGHIHCLKEAKRQGEVLIVGLNSDASVRDIKGESRPLIPQEDRAAILAALSCVDFVVIFDEPTPLELIKLLKPHILVKGGDYKKDDIVGAKEVEAWGGRVVTVPLVPGTSTSSIIERIRNFTRPAV